MSSNATSVPATEDETLPSWEEANRQTMEYLADPCICGAKRYLHGVGGCRQTDCDMPYMMIPARAA